MDQQHDVKIDPVFRSWEAIFGSWKPVRRALKDAGGLPVVVSPLDQDRAIAEGRVCLDLGEFADAMQWAYRLSPQRLARISPARQPAT